MRDNPYVTRPRIALPLPHSSRDEYNARSLPHYQAAIEQAGGKAVVVPLNASMEEVVQLSAGCQGVCLPGSPADVTPADYGAEPDPATNPNDPARGTVDRALIAYAEQHDLPLLGICYGAQSLNVYRGGTLIQHLGTTPVDHAVGGTVAVAHTAQVVIGTLLDRLLDSEEAVADGKMRVVPVNSSHHQALDRLGRGLQLSALCPVDQVIEAVEDPSRRFLLAVQWHPERTTESSPTSRAIFRKLIEEAAR